MKKAIVVGALGFVGFALCQRLLEEEYEVIGIDQIQTGNVEKIQEQKLAEISRNGNFTFIKKRLEDIILEQLTDQCKVIYYCLHDDQVNQENSKEKLAINQSRLIKVMDYCQKTECKFIYLSTYEVYKENEQVLNENTVKAPRNIIGMMKAKEEDEIQTYSQLESRFSYIILRLPTIYGPWQPEYMTYQQLINGCPAPTMDPIKEDIIFIYDLADLLLTIINTSLKNKTILISSNKKNQWQKGFNLLENNYNCNQESTGNETKITETDEEVIRHLKTFGGCIKTTIEEGISHQKEHYLYLQKLKSLGLL